MVVSGEGEEGGLHNLNENEERERGRERERELVGWWVWYGGDV